MQVPPLSELNPWFTLSQFAGLPNVKWCESQLNSWVTEPANTWSNLAFIIVGIIVTYLNRGNTESRLKFYGPSMIVLGFFSGIYHASYTFFFQLFDFLGMYLVFLVPVLINWEEWKGHRKNFMTEYIGLSIFLTVMTVIFYLINIPIQLLILMLVIFIIISEHFLKEKRRQNGHSYAFYYLSVLFLGIAATFSALDVSRTFCHPEDHLIQGHALWHIFTAIAGLTNFLFYKSRTDMIKYAPN